MLIGITAVLISMDWKLGLLTLDRAAAADHRAGDCGCPTPSSSFRAGARRLLDRQLGRWPRTSTACRTVQESRREELNFELYKEKAHENFEAQVRAAWMTQIMVPDRRRADRSRHGHRHRRSAAMRCWAATLEVGVMVAFIFYVQRFFDPVRMLSMQYTIMQRAMAAGHADLRGAGRARSAIADEPGASRPGATWPATVEFKNVTFGYDAGAAGAARHQPDA